ncbi:hypothetical protein J6590_010297 [Homalodisca vitripennis]|nr:hypothetical protein J6590_010297 [Homalodisca vitripennis]
MKNKSSHQFYDGLRELREKKGDRASASILLRYKEGRHEGAATCSFSNNWSIIHAARRGCWQLESHLRSITSDRDAVAEECGLRQVTVKAIFIRPSASVHLPYTSAYSLFTTTSGSTANTALSALLQQHYCLPHYYMQLGFNHIFPNIRPFFSSDSSPGQEVLDTVFRHLNLLETAYFGLRYLDAANQTSLPRMTLYKTIQSPCIGRRLSSIPEGYAQRTTRVTSYTKQKLRLTTVMFRISQTYRSLNIAKGYVYKQFNRWLSGTVRNLPRAQVDLCVAHINALMLAACNQKNPNHQSFLRVFGTIPRLVLRINSISIDILTALNAHHNFVGRNLPTSTPLTEYIQENQNEELGANREVSKHFTVTYRESVCSTATKRVKENRITGPSDVYCNKTIAGRKLQTELWIVVSLRKQSKSSDTREGNPAL